MPGGIAVGGDSAGGMLAAIVTQLAREKGGPKLAYQLLLFPNTQMGGETVIAERIRGGLFPGTPHHRAFQQPLSAAAAWTRIAANISPLRAKDFAGLPPAYVMLGGYDPLHDEGLAYAEKLRAAGVKVTIADYADMVHASSICRPCCPRRMTPWPRRPRR